MPLNRGLNEGDVFAGYTIVRRLGSGGMGEVYLAQHPRLPRRDALKVLPATLTSDAEYRQRFSREADIAAELWHPHIVGIHDRGEFEGQLWLSMDYVEGTDAPLAKRRRADRKPLTHTAPDVFVPACDRCANRRIRRHRGLRRPTRFGSPY
jgi:serine/threonine-protein kinase